MMASAAPALGISPLDAGTAGARWRLGAPATLSSMGTASPKRGNPFALWSHAQIEAMVELYPTGMPVKEILAKINALAAPGDPPKSKDQLSRLRILLTDAGRLGIRSQIFRNINSVATLRKTLANKKRTDVRPSRHLVRDISMSSNDGCDSPVRDIPRHLRRWIDVDAPESVRAAAIQEFIAVHGLLRPPFFDQVANFLGSRHHSVSRLADGWRVDGKVVDEDQLLEIANALCRRLNKAPFYRVDQRRH
jgi:hypothetical protein